MKYAFFQGCNIPVRIEQYANATEAVFNKFGIELQVIPEFNCCGYPVRNVDEKAYILPSVRNMAIAEKAGLDILVICNCCFASLQKARHMLNGDEQLKAELNTILAKEGLKYNGAVKVKHYLTILHEDVGTEKIKSKLVNKFKDLRISVIHGCHILRPREITLFDDSFVPAITEELMATAGATSLDWQGKLECCGAALAGINDEVSHMLLKDKITGALAAGAEYITPICSYCHLQFDTTQKNLHGDGTSGDLLPVLLYPQLLGLCLGIDEKTLGIEKNSTIEPADIERLKSLLGPPVEEKKKRRKKKAAA
ncbi:MAG: CoB--CoM heterodisulfide reductase iron-sulfur subunit B family protein [Deltaproteobacteria bacterium]|nr:CoB--CoM heterodisulfide reductase iron-sulfur subunit B family protein [Deltaproteobacteria bacterium]MBW2658120.1 CoB--CoM heterodisulfide reductase iron-sulfur subunit B family protein [Deltaproteobacteria bacterium]